MERYSKQILFKEINKEGQEKINKSRVLLIGCGALGTVIANNLVRAGVGYIKIVDRDYIELSNLQRQTLFDEDDIASNLPKAIAAEKKLKIINSDVMIESEVTDVNTSNILRLCEGMDIILDGTDNFSTRYLINDVAIKLNIPWVYGGVIGSTGMTYTVIPGATPCYRCISPDMPSIGSVETCDTAGVLNTITNVIASMQSTEALKILSGNSQAVIKGLRFIDLWYGDFEEIEISKNDDCKACGQKDFQFINSKVEEAVSLCGKNSIQVNPVNKNISMDSVIERLKLSGIDVGKNNSFFVKFDVEDVTFTLFRDGRAIIKNVDDKSRAKSLYAKYIGL